jgi:DNA-binding CsgD family transcriptional regulator
VLDAIPGPALLVTAEGGLVASNAHARQWLESAGAREEALRAARWRRSTADLALTAIDGASGVVLLVRPPGDPSDAPAATSPSDWHLTPREQDILSLLVDGRSNRTIAAALDVGERTVETHLSAMFGKAGVASRAELVARARRA